MLVSSGISGWLLAAVAFLAPASSANITGEPLDPVPLEVLQEILADAGLSKARVSSYQRTAQKQAALMYGICERDGVAKAKRLYSKKSHSILDAYVEHQGEPEADIVAAMATEVRAVLEQLGPGRRTMMHVDSANFTFDIAPSSLASSAKFKAALKRHPDVVRHFVPGGAERAFHLEVSRKQHALAGRWVGKCDDGSALRLRLAFAVGAWSGQLGTNAEKATKAAVSVDRKARTIAFGTGDDAYRGSLAKDYATFTLSNGGVSCAFKPA